MENANLAALMRTIVRKEIATGLETNLKPIKIELSKIQQKVTSCLDKVDSLKAAANEAEIRLSKLEHESNTLAAEVSLLKQKGESLENQSRKFNLRIHGLPEGIEQGRPTSFVNDMLRELFDQADLGPLLPANIAHRIGGRDKVSCCMITRLYSFKVRQRIIRLAIERRKQPDGLKYRGHKISIFPDLTADQRKQQAVFDEIRAMLRKTGIRYGVAYPAELLITFGNRTHPFVNLYRRRWTSIELKSSPRWTVDPARPLRTRRYPPGNCKYNRSGMLIWEKINNIDLVW